MNKIIKNGVTVSLLCFVLASCVSKGTPELSGLSPQAQAEIIKNYGGIYKVGNPYQIAGRWYYPKENYHYSETGIASWYGEDFNGKMTANGERYNMNTLTAAHRTLPLPSIVRVTNLQNGRSIVVRVNDRGPYVKDRIIDLSKHGAQLLGYMGQGTTKVKVEILEAESKALKEAMLTGNISDETAKKLAAQKPAHSLFESSAERVKISEETEKKDMAAIYGSAGGKKVESGSYQATGKTVEPAIYGSATAVDGNMKTASMGTVDQLTKQTENNGIYGKAANNPNKVGTVATTGSSTKYQYLSGYYYIHAGSFTNYELAHKLMVKLKEYGSSHIVQANVNGTNYYRVSIGPYDRIEEAKVALAKLKYYGFKDMRIEKK